MITQRYIKQALDYKPDTGEFIWKNRPLEHFKTEKIGNYWNSRYSGTKAGSFDAKGYLLISVDGRLFKSHRLAWLYVHGHFPERQIDHINGIKADNRIDNLRDVSGRDNLKNRRLGKNNTSGVIGVSWCERDKVWVAYIAKHGKRSVLGNYKCKLDAVAARMRANGRHGYHENHGKKLAS